MEILYSYSFAKEIIISSNIIGRFPKQNFLIPSGTIKTGEIDG